jgi:hypothetical protein
MQPHVVTSPANQQKLQLASRAWQELLRQGLQRGFYGSIALELVVQDGTLQHVRRRVERTER